MTRWRGAWTARMSDVTGDLNTPPPSPRQVLEAVKLLSQQYESNAEENRRLSEEFARRSREGRWFALILSLVVAVCVCAAYVMRHVDQGREADRRAALKAQIFTQRESQVQGCERGNDQRVTLAEIINKAIVPQPAPPNLPPEFVDLYLAGQARTVALRAELLALPGVQIVDCQAAYPRPKEVP